MNQQMNTYFQIILILKLRKTYLNNKSKENIYYLKK